jgi:hypothetical protein
VLLVMRCTWRRSVWCACCGGSSVAGSGGCAWHVSALC